ncbi:hypothetical protein L3Q82_021112 [Scortum barcoo]|uniref:Uncharacterized protein n=1 Tax=Scortum barcoo TaxID=214431 RepID=A0ACB8X355_9TELE|nr:hypothetical protein L3Q82_021112 [Scortum barcoo]
MEDLLTGVPVVQVCFGPGSGATGSRWGEVVGYGSVKSASRMNGAVLIFLDSPEKVSDVVVSGVVIQDSFTPVHPLVNPARKITISNVPPFIRNEVLAKELSRFGQLVSPIKMLSLGSKSPLLRTRRVSPQTGVHGSKAGKPPAESESESLLSQEEQTLYSPADIKKFLQGTKGTRLLKVEDHFSDLKLFIESAKPLTKTSGDVGESVLTEQEIYRLKKLIVKLTESLSLFLAVSNNGGTLERLRLSNFVNKFTRNVTRDMTRSMRDLEIQLVELQSRAESTGDRGLLNSLKSKKRALANLLGVAAEEDLLEVFNDCLERGRLPLSCRRAVITLLPKKGDLQELKNWRPVSLLCTDYKIMSKVLASRLREVMASIIHPDQTYCVPGRLISDNVTLIRDILEVSGSLAVDTGLISIDQEKAFDRVEHKYLWQTLAAFGFSPGFIAKIRVLYCDIASVLKINGGLSAPFRVQRGIRQGCCLSGMLYSLAIEPLLHKLRNKLSGVCVPGCDVSFKLSACKRSKVGLRNGNGLLPKMSYRGRVLILNNLISTALWHRLACVDPPVSLLSRIQAVLVDFFWDRLHWVPQSILFLPKEEGGQGLVHLASRGAAFPPSVLTETPHRTCRPGLEAFILLHLAEVWWSETGSGSVPDGLQESGHFISASVFTEVFSQCGFY